MSEARELELVELGDAIEDTKGPYFNVDDPGVGKQIL